MWLESEKSEESGGRRGTARKERERGDRGSIYHTNIYSGFGEPTGRGGQQEQE